MRRWVILIATHLAMLAMGFAGGVYTLPILTAPQAPDAAALRTISAETLYAGRLARDLKGSDLLHCKRAARTVLTGMCYSVGSATRQGSSSLTRFIGQSAMTSRT